MRHKVYKVKGKNNLNEENENLTLETQRIQHQEFFNNFDPKVFDNFNLDLKEFPLKYSPRIIYDNVDDKEFSKLIKNIQRNNHNIFDFDAKQFQNCEEIYNSISKKRRRERNSLKQKACILFEKANYLI